MLQFVIKKIKNKKWLNASLWLGLVLLVAMTSSLPMFENGADNNILRNKFEQYIRENNRCPVVIGRSGTFQNGEVPDAAKIFSKMEEYENIWLSYLRLKPEARQAKAYLTAKSTRGNYSSGSFYLQIACMESLEEHIEIVDGAGYQEELNQCVISEAMMDELGFVSGEELTFDMKDLDGKPVALTISGIYDVADSEDLFWYETPESFDKTVFVSRETFDRLLQSDVDGVSYQCSVMFDYRDITSGNEGEFQYYLSEFHRLDDEFFDELSPMLSEYDKDSRTAAVMIRVLELPVLILLFAFIYMVSNQILQMEAGEISMLKGRGVGKWQLVGVYVLQSVLLNLLSLVPGILLGMVFCKIAAGTDGFMQFSAKMTSEYVPVPSMLVYGGTVSFVADWFIVLPVLRHQKLSIVEHRQKKADRTEKPLWRRWFLDVLGLMAALYLQHNYNRQQDIIALSILQGDTLDPIMFLVTVFFVCSVGLLSLRMIDGVLRLIYRVGEKKLSPPFYTSFLQMIRSFNRQSFLHIFIIMTIAMGSFYANVAQMVNENKTERIAYDTGADVVIEEPFSLNVYHPTRETTTWQYEEPDYARYGDLRNSLCDSMTRVMEDDNVQARIDGKRVEQCHLMAIQTKEFGQTAELKDGLNDRHWYYALNALAAKPNGVIITRNMAKDYGLKVGDEIIYSRFSPLKHEEGKEIAHVQGEICAIVDAWPAHDSYRYEQNEDGEVKECANYLLVANYDYVVSVFGISPYTIWLRLNNETSVSDVRQYLDEAGIAAEVYGKSEKISEMKKSALIQITNGIFTLSFVVAVILCIVGFYIYWFNDLTQRQLLFGIYRAMGMQMKELKTMLLNEQILSTVSDVLFGGATGVLATFIFARLLAVVYLPTKHNIPVAVTLGGVHFVKLAVFLGVVFALCMVLLWYRMRKMQLAQVLKLGED